MCVPRRALSTTGHPSRREVACGDRREPLGGPPSQNNGLSVEEPKYLASIIIIIIISI